jgi:MFS family permease
VDETEREAPSTRDALRRVMANPGLRRVQLAFAGSLLGDWAYATAITVWAYLEGGATAVGVFAAARFVAMALAGPLGALVADRVSRRSFMMSTDLIRAAMVSVAAVSMGLDGPAFVVYALGLLSGVVGAPFRAAQAGLLPSLVSAPDELTASNAVAANLENVVVFVGPSLGALLVGATNVEVVFWLNVATFLWSFLMVRGIRVEERPSAGDDSQDPEKTEGFATEVMAGFATVTRDANLRAVALLAAAQGFIWGALTVFTVVIAVRTLDLGPEGVGYIDALLGVGTVIGGIVVMTRIARGRLGQDMAVGVLGWSLPLLVMAAFPSPAAVLVALAVIGLMDPWVNLGLETIPQRISPAQVISRVYAAVESALVGAMALGAGLAPLLMHLLGFRGALAVVGGLVAVYAVTTFPRMRRLDARLVEPEGLALLRSLPLFAPLPPAQQETLAQGLTRVEVVGGTTVVTEGETGDTFYIIAAGEVEVTQDGRPLRVEQAGDFFGEIALLRDVPRTATVTATTDTVLLAMERQDFLAAVSGVQESRLAAQDVVSRRLGV